MRLSNSQCLIASFRSSSRKLMENTIHHLEYSQPSPYLEPARHIEVREGLSGRVDLIVVLGSGKASQFDHIVREPLGFAWQKHKAVFEPPGLGMETHDLVRSRRRLVRA